MPSVTWYFPPAWNETVNFQLPLMRFSKPAWVTHQGSPEEKRVPLYSCHVHPDGTRLATGGLDAKIRIWSTQPILRPEMESQPKSLCTLTMHAGPVLVVRWNHSGRWLASGSDDAIVMIWDLDPQGGGSVWGSEETNIEGWKALKRLPGHESDVTDLAWSPQDRYLASVGLDSKVIIWCGHTLNILRKLDQHQGFVKGVCWDPVGEFVATQSDDKSVKVWRTVDWGLEATVTKPFQDSPGSTFFRRLSWSPDGAHITASNAMNNNGYIFIAAVIARNEWTSDISLVGHENTVEVACYNPHIFLREPAGAVQSTNICSVVALGADDLSVSIWQTKSPRPLIVAKDVFERQIFDLSWSQDGATLYACSLDGTIAVFDFDKDELEGITSLEDKEAYLQRFGFKPAPYQPPPPLMQTPIHQPPLQEQQHMYRPPVPQPVIVQPPVFADDNRPAVDKKGRRRIKPVFVSHLSSSVGMLPGPFSNQQPQQPSAIPAPFTSHSLPQAHSTPAPAFSNSNHQHQAYGGSSSMANTAGSTGPTPPIPSAQFFRDGSAPYANGFADDEGDGNMSVQIDSWDNTAPGGSRKQSAGAKRKASEMEVDDLGTSTVGGNGAKLPKARTLGGDRIREPLGGGPVRELRSIFSGGGETMSASGRGGPSVMLNVPTLKTHISAKTEEGKDGTADVFEAINTGDGKPSEVTYTSAKQVQFLDYPSAPVLTVALSTCFCAAGLEDGSLIVYSLTGRRLMPTLLLDSPCAFLECSKQFLMAITALGRLYVWNLKTIKTVFPPTSLESIITSSSITSALIRPNGVPVIITSNGVAYSYDQNLSSIIKINELRWSAGSDQWEGKQRSNKVVASKGVVATLESTLSEMQLQDPVPPSDINGINTASSSSAANGGADRPAWWSIAYTLGHLETRLHAAKILDSPTEYKSALAHYCRKIAEEGYRGKAEELIKELCGPIYWKPGREESWCPTVAGLQKRDLLKDVLATFAKSRTLAKLGQDWQDTLKRISAES